MAAGALRVQLAAPRALRLLAAALVSLLLVVAAPFTARAEFAPPPLSGHVVDTAGELSQGQVRALDTKLDALRQRTGFEVVAFVVGSLEGETIEDVAYTAFNTWQIGQKGLDNGVLLVIAPAERRVRIETGKGVGGALTDLQSNDIIREQIAPRLREGRVAEAIDQGTSAIAEALVAGTPGGEAKAPPKGPDFVKIGVGAGVLLLVIVLSIISPAFRSILWFFLQMVLWSRGGGGGGGGSGYSGGGGRSGGGGSSDSY